MQRVHAEIVLQEQMVAIIKEPLPELPIDLHRTDYKFILCHVGYETVLEELQAEKVKLSGSFIVQQAETVIHFVAEENGTGVISAFVLEATPNDLCHSPVAPEIKMEIGLVANDLDDLTPVATALIDMIREECGRSQQAKG